MGFFFFWCGIRVSRNAFLVPTFHLDGKQEDLQNEITEQLGSYASDAILSKYGDSQIDRTIITRHKRKSLAKVERDMRSSLLSLFSDVEGRL